jgi:hypothetical protein
LGFVTAIALKPEDQAALERQAKLRKYFKIRLAAFSWPFKDLAAEYTPATSKGK